MTEHEMRVRLADAMGWTEIRAPQGIYADWSGRIPGAPPIRVQLPDPLGFDDDAARLRAWCVGRGWIVELCSDRHRAVGTVRYDDQVRIGQGMAATPDEPDPLRRERLALCQAVLQALDTVEAGGEA